MPFGRSLQTAYFFRAGAFFLLFLAVLAVLAVLARVFWIYPGISASTRSGLPEPLTIFSGGAITIAPVGGN